MIYSPYATKLTRMIVNGEKNPERDPVNKKALGKPWRHSLWLDRKAKEKKDA